MTKSSNEAKSDNQLLQEIDQKLNYLIGMIGIQGKSREDQVVFLVALGFTNVEISRLSGIPKGTVDGIRAGKKTKE